MTYSRSTKKIVPFDGFSSSTILGEQSFLRMLCLERKRTERSCRRFVLMLLESGSMLKAGGKHVPAEILSALARSSRDTDIKGWYKEGAIFGVIFTEIGSAEGRSVANALMAKVSAALCATLSIEQINDIRLSFHVFPEDFNNSDSGGLANTTLYPDVSQVIDSRRNSRLVKRAVDIAGGIVGLILFSPLLLVIALLVKLTSKGPILFRQVRIGQYGNRFTFLKFRSMYFKNDPSIHEEYVKRLIAGKLDSEKNGGGKSAVFKLTNDPRITPIGRFLRKTSLDELPQFLNVLMGSMSLVGPRPPIPYEFEHYDIWHRRRLLAVKPGITGLWQVGGRSGVTFDEMIRMDLEYAKSWSLWLDLVILLQTPRAVISGAGAY